MGYSRQEYWSGLPNGDKFLDGFGMTGRAVGVLGQASRQLGEGMVRSPLGQVGSRRGWRREGCSGTCDHTGEALESVLGI